MKTKEKSMGMAAILAAAVLLFIFTGCENPAGSGSGTITETLRYSTVQYRGAGTASGGGYTLIYSAHDTDSDLYYYVYLLGHIDRVPVAYRQAVIWDGVTPVTIGYSSEVTNEYTITEGVERATQYSFTSNDTHGWKVGTELGIKGKVFSAKISAEVSGQYSREEMNGRSMTNTYETAVSKGNSTTDSIEVTIGNNNQPAGKYRYSLFCTTDVYYVLITDSGKTEVEDNYIAVCARPASYAWGIDYEPNLGGSFGKTAPGDLFQFPNLDLAALPDPLDEFEEEMIPQLPLVATPSATLTSGIYIGTQYVKLSCAEPGAVIFYTLNGNNPTEDSTRYFDGYDITISENTTIRAIAVKSGMTDSLIMTESYTITEAVNYVKNIYFGYSSNKTNALSNLRAQSSESMVIIEKDLNTGVGGDYIYMGYTTTINAKEAIRGLALTYGKNILDSFNHDLERDYGNGFGYNRIANSPDLNKGAGGNYIWLNETRDSGQGVPIRNLFVQLKTDDMSVISEAGWNRVEMALYNDDDPDGSWYGSDPDLNKGCTNREIYLWMQR
ncbi:MAG: chitobiase/beta-hexosaminidase C-terminal domain-containing protein [Treponema sp.]|nr:chitobiase/beta-hexosaminidase C-terminal domain-containing protein [Treponema sp.]